MKRFGILAVCLSWGLTGCVGGAPAAEQPTDIPTAAQSPTEEPTSEAPSSEEPTAEPTSEEPSEEPTSEAPTGDTSERGHSIVSEGDSFEIKGDSGSVIAEVTLAAVETGRSCDSGFDDPPENEQFLFLDFEVKTLPALAEEKFLNDYSINPYELVVLDRDGERAKDSIGNSYFCLDLDSYLPSALGPGESSSGTVVLDVPYDSGVVVYEPFYGVSGDSFEFEF